MAKSKHARFVGPAQPPHRQAQRLLPALYGSDFTTQIGGDFSPGLQALAAWRIFHFLLGGALFGHEVPGVWSGTRSVSRLLARFKGDNMRHRATFHRFSRVVAMLSLGTRLCFAVLRAQQPIPQELRGRFPCTFQISAAVSGG